MHETFRPIPAFTGYSASNMGRVRADYALAMVAPKGQTRCLAERGGILILNMESSGYLQAVLNVGKLRKHRMVHRLVMAAFVGQCPDDMQVNHKNGEKTDNRLENLEYMTHRDNMIHAAKVLGVMSRKGTAHGNSLITEEMAARIKERLAAVGPKCKMIATELGVSIHIVSNIRRGSWAHVMSPNSSPTPLSHYSGGL